MVQAFRLNHFIVPWANWKMKPKHWVLFDPDAK